MVKKISLLLMSLLGAVSCLFVIASCSATEPVEHKHTYAEEWSYDEEYHWHEVTCGHDILDKAEHVLGDWEIEKTPTIDEEGLKRKYCEVCGAEIESETILAYKDDYNYTGNGTFEEPYAIRSRTDLYYIRQKDGEGVYFRVCNDINLGDVPFEPFDDFLGNLDGGNSYIYDFNTKDGNFADIGLFRKNHGVIANLKLASSDENKKCFINTSGTLQDVHCGMLVGDNYGGVYNCSIENSEIRVSSEFATGDNGSTNVFVGGLIGRSMSGEIKNCYSINNYVYGYSKNASQSSTNFKANVYSGGLIGFLNSDLYGCYSYDNNLETEAYSCYHHTGNIFFEYYYGQTNQHMGGIIGYVASGSTATALIGYENSLKAAHTSGSGTNTTFNIYNGSYSCNLGKAIGYNAGTLKYVYGKTGDSALAGYIGTNFYCEQIDIEHYNEMAIFMEEGIWALDEKTEITQGEGEEEIETIVYNVAFNEKSRYVFEKPIEPEVVEEDESNSDEEDTSSEESSQE